MHRIEPLDCLQLENELIIDDEIHPLCADDTIPVDDLEPTLPIERDPVSLQLEADRPAVGPLGQAWTEDPMNRDAAADHAIYQHLGFRRKGVWNSSHTPVLYSSILCPD